MSLQGHHLNKLLWAGVPYAKYQISWKSARRIQRRFLKGFYHIWGWRPSWSCDLHHVIRFSFPFDLKACIQNFVQIGTVVSEKIQFEFLYVNDLGFRSRNDLELQYSHIFIYSNKCLPLLPFRSLAATVSEKSTFSYRKAEVTKFDLVLN